MQPQSAITIQSNPTGISRSLVQGEPLLVAGIETLEALAGRLADPAQPVRARVQAVAELGAVIDGLFLTQPQETPYPIWDEWQRIQSISDAVTPFLRRAASVFNQELCPLMAHRGLVTADLDTLDPPQLSWLHTHFRNALYPLLTPLAVDAGHPFPRIQHPRINLLVELVRPEAGLGSPAGLRFGVVRMPGALPRLVRMPRRVDRPEGFVHLWAEEVIRAHIQDLFPGVRMAGVYLFRVLSRPRAPRHHETVRHGHRPPEQAVRLDVEAHMPDYLRTWLAGHLQIPSATIVRNQPPMALAELTCVVEQLPPERWHGVRRQMTRLWDFFFGHTAW